MAINIFPSKFSLIIICTIFITTLLHLISPSHCLHPPHKNPLDSTRGLLFGEKTRLGSTPPSCHNKCNQCHPCMAVQVPTLPSHNRVQPGMSRPGATTPLDYYESSPSSAAGNRYSNYKPLGWKCGCNNNFYNP